MSRRITVISTRVIREGQGTKGPWTLSSVEANDADGRPISEQLKTFANLPRGEVEVEVERQEHEQYGTSFLLKPVKGANGGSASAGGGEVAELRRRIERLESEVARLSGLVDRRDPGSEPAHDALGASAVGGLSDEDIPF